MSWNDQEIARELMPCVRCGQCRSVCPVFLAKGVESDSPRGRAALVRALLEGSVSLNDSFIQKIDQCLLCGTCSQECPSGVRMDRIIMAVRERIIQLRGMPFGKRLLIRSLLPNVGRLQTIMPLASRIQGLAGNKVSSEYRKPRFRLPVIGTRLIPHVPSRNLHALMPSDTGTRSDRRVILFAGCMITYAYPKIAQSIRQILDYHQIRVVIPPDQVCCGLLARSVGDTKTFDRLRISNLKTISKAGNYPIVAACASCGSALKEFYGPDLPNPIFDLSELLIDLVQSNPPPGKVERRITFHDPCHLRKGQNIKDQPRRLLKLTPGVSFVEVQDPDRCCGFGGTFSISHPVLSQKIGYEKVRLLIDTGADMVVTSCPGCMLQLADGLNRSGSTASVAHLAEVLAMAYSGDRVRCSRRK